MGRKRLQREVGVRTKRSVKNLSEFLSPARASIVLLAGAILYLASSIVSFSPAYAQDADAGHPSNTNNESKYETRLMRVTAYCPCSKCCGEHADGITANGHKICPRDAFVAADRKFAFGTELIVPGYNEGRPVRVLDRGGSIKDNRLDVFFHTHEEALQWGVQYLEVKIRG
jgi:3D (Asp-Asp-Asp) domain-containing protein